MKQTINHKLNKPDYTDVADIADINANMDIIDENLGRVTTPDYTDPNGKQYVDIDGMHLRTDNAIYATGIKIVDIDPCVAGVNLTEDIVTDVDNNDCVTAKIDEAGAAFFSGVTTQGLEANYVVTDEILLNGADLTRSAIHFKRAKGAMYTDNSSNNKSDGSRKFVFGVYKDTPQLDTNLMPDVNPDAGIMPRIGSDITGNPTYIDVYGDRIVGRTEGASIEFDTIKAASEIKINGNSVTEMISEKADVLHTHSQSDIDGLTDMLSGLEDDISSKANATHTHQASDITGAIPVSKGGTGATNASNARKNLGLKAAATYDVSSDVVRDNSKLATSEALYNAVRTCTELETGKDLDGIDLTGNYYGNSAVNGPVGNEHYALKVFGGSANNSSDIIVQEYYSQSGVYYRVSGNGVAAYGSWIKIGG